MKALIIKVINYFKQFIMFSLVGLVNMGIYLGLYYLLLALKIGPVASNAIAYFLSSINGYILNRTWVFKAKNTGVKQSVLKFYVVYGSSLLLSTLLTHVFANLLGINEKIVPLLNLLFTTPYNYFFQKIWAFKKPTEDDTMQPKKTDKDA